MNLDMDIGNSRIKWRLADDNSDAEREGVAASLDELLADLVTLPRPDQVRVASVRQDTSFQEISDWSREHWQVTPGLAVVSSERAGVTNAYGDYGRMGIDRWLAILAGYRRVQAACLVIDAGTAITIDAINGSGQHLGGYILPGLRLMLDSLEANTGIKLSRREFGAELALGDSTESAVLNGILAQTVALIESVAIRLGEQESQLTMLISGGDAPALAAGLAWASAYEVELCPGLVLDGLALAEMK